jgi:uncharacterized protein YabN with tetrapyrrole methylase and pyrophosphatase domain
LKTGSLTVVGTGIQLAGHVTMAAKAWIEQADKLLFAVADPATAKWLATLNSTAEPLPYNRNNQRRKETYAQMVERILAEVRQGLNVCAAFYGHPGVFANPAHESIRQARQEGFRAEMLPGISAEDCLFADLGVDPGKHGCQSFEATDFLIRRRKFDPTSVLILWQIAFIGNRGFYEEGEHLQGLRILTEVLQNYYAADSETIIYEAAVYHPVCQSVIQRMPLDKLPEAKVTEISTLYMPPSPPLEIDMEMARRLGMSF